MSYPCLVCSEEVRTRQHAVECDWCHRWQHRTCGTGISLAAYREAMKMGGMTYVCRPCLDAEVQRSPVPAPVDVSTDSVADSVAEMPTLMPTLGANDDTESVYLQVTRDDISDTDIEHGLFSVADSTADDMDDSREWQSEAIKGPGFKPRLLI